MSRHVALVIFALSALPCPAEPQPTHVISDRCGRCTLTVRATLAFGDHSEAVASVAAGLIHGVVIDSRSRAYAIGAGLGTLLEYEDRNSPGGLGRSGPGPGEFQVIRSIFLDRHDTLLVVGMDRRLSVWSPERRFIREVRIALLPDRLIRVDDTHLVASGPHRTPESAGFPLHLLTDEGVLLRSFGTPEPVVDPELPTLERRQIAPGPRPGTFWAVQPDRYQVELWDVERGVVENIERRVEWFPPRSGGAQVEGQPPLPFIRDMAADSSGNLWFLLLVADEDWRSSLRTPGKPITREILDKEFDTIIEVVDPATHSLIARRRFDPFFERFAAPAAPYTISMTETGDAVVGIIFLQHPIKEEINK